MPSLHEIAKYRDFDVEEEYRADWDHFKFWELESVVTEPVSRGPTRWRTFPEERGIIMLNIRIATPPPRAPRDCRRES